MTAEIVAKPELWAGSDLPLLPIGKARQELALYIDMLLSWNKKLNLTGSQNPASIMAELIQDSFFLAPFLENLFRSRGWQTPLVLDPGAGAGLPGIPLRLVWPCGNYIMIERRQKRALFLQTVCSRLKLPSVQIRCGDAQCFFKGQYQAKAQCVLSRAFLPWRELLPFSEPALASDGLIIIMANDPPPALPQGWRLADSKAYSLPRKTRWFWALERQP